MYSIVVCLLLHFLLKNYCQVPGQRVFLAPFPLAGLRDTTGSESDGGDSNSTKSEGANGTATIQPKKVKGIGFGDIFKDKPIKLRPRSIEVDNDFLPFEKVPFYTLIPHMFGVDFFFSFV